MKLRTIPVLPLLTAVLVLFNASLNLVRAQEFVISGNGAGSDNQITAQVENTSTVSQTNDAQVTNTVNANADTGGNTASQNANGSTGVDTGNIKVDTNIQNTLNESSAGSPCCEASPSDITISGNGAGSTNSVELNNDTSTNVTINNSADVENNVRVNAISGENSANYNGGNVSIDTGNIKVSNEIKNGPVNVYNVSGGSVSPSVSINVGGNGAETQNNVSASFDSVKIAKVNSVAKLGNIVFVNAVTGDNHADGNMGDVSIKTGDISIVSTITNDPINSGGVEFNCCVVDPGTNPTPTPIPTPMPSPTPDPSHSDDPGSSSNSSSSSGGSGSSGSGPAVLGLSFTGSSGETAVVLFAGLIMIFGGFLVTSNAYGKKESLF